MFSRVHVEQDLAIAAVRGSGAALQRRACQRRARICRSRRRLWKRWGRHGDVDVDVAEIVLTRVTDAGDTVAFSSWFPRRPSGVWMRGFESELYIR